MQLKFEIQRQDLDFMLRLDYKMKKQWVRTRGVLKKHWENNGGMTNPELARTKMKDDCRSQEDWNALCMLWESDNHKVNVNCDLIII